MGRLGTPVADVQSLYPAGMRRKRRKAAAHVIVTFDPVFYPGHSGS
jgi:hypothetical protein